MYFSDDSLYLHYENWFLLNIYIVLFTVIIVKGEHWAVTQKNIKCDMDALCVLRFALDFSLADL